MNKKLFIGVGAAIIAVVIGLLIFINTPGQKLKKQLTLGQKYLSELKYDDAVFAYSSALEIDDKCEEAYVGLTQAYIGLKQYDNAYDTVQRGMAAVQESFALSSLLDQLAGYYVDMGDTFIMEPNYAEAILAYEKALGISPGNADIYIKIARAYIETGDYDKASKTVEDGITKAGESAELTGLKEEIEALIKPAEGPEEEEAVEEPVEEPVEDTPAEEETAKEETKESAEETTVEEEQQQEEPAESAPVAAAGTVTLADGSVISPGGSIPLSQLSGASFIVGGSGSVWFAGIAGQGPYYVSQDPEPDWAFEAQYPAGTAVPLAQYASWFSSDPSYDYLTVELRGSGGNQEYNLHITR